MNDKGDFMKQELPTVFLEAFESIQGFPVFTTVDHDHKPNSVYVGCYKLSGTKIVVANNKFYKTAENVLKGGYGSFLFLTKDRIAFQVKGVIENHTSGSLYDEMKQWLDPKYPGYSAVVLTIDEIYNGREKLK